MELSRNSYLEFEILVFLYKLVVVNIFQRFFCIEYDQTLRHFELKEVTIFIQIVNQLQCRCRFGYFGILRLWVYLFCFRSSRIKGVTASALPDIGKKIVKLPHQPPVFGDIYTYKPI